MRLKQLKELTQRMFTVKINTKNNLKKQKETF